MTLFKKDVVISIGDILIEMVDYVHRKLTWLEGHVSEINKLFEIMNESDQSLDDKYVRLEYTTAISCISIIRFLSDSIAELPLSVVTRILETHDFIIFFIRFLFNKPWLIKKDGKRYVYNDNSWIQSNASNLLQLNKVEAQIWITLYNLLLDPECAKKYKYTTNNKNEILKVFYSVKNKN